MSRYSLGLDETLHTYLQRVSVHETDALAGIREETVVLSDSQMQIAPEQGQFLHFLVGLTGARHVLEVGTYTGYSALWMALALPRSGSLITCDVDDTRPAMGKPYWRRAGVDSLIDLRIGAALDTMDGLLTNKNGSVGSFDLIFIDADKEHYDEYYERGLKLLRNNGLMAVDNTLWGGRVIDRRASDESTAAIQAFNIKVGSDPRVQQTLLPVGDGMTLIRKL